MTTQAVESPPSVYYPHCFSSFSTLFSISLSSIFHPPSSAYQPLSLDPTLVHLSNDPLPVSFISHLPSCFTLISLFACLLPSLPLRRPSTSLLSSTPSTTQLIGVIVSDRPSAAASLPHRLCLSYVTRLESELDLPGDQVATHHHTGGGTGRPPHWGGGTGRPPHCRGRVQSYASSVSSISYVHQGSTVNVWRLEESWSSFEMSRCNRLVTL